MTFSKLNKLFFQSFAAFFDSLDFSFAYSVCLPCGMTVVWTSSMVKIDCEVWLRVWWFVSSNKSVGDHKFITTSNRSSNDSIAANNNGENRKQYRTRAKEWMSVIWMDGKPYWDVIQPTGIRFWFGVVQPIFFFFLFFCLPYWFALFGRLDDSCE